MAQSPPPRTGNRILDSLPVEQRMRVVPSMREHPITPRDVLMRPGDAIRNVHFPLSGVISLMTPLAHGISIENATVGPEGMLGLHAFLGGRAPRTVEGVAQVPGRMLVMDAGVFRAGVMDDGRLPATLLAYTQALLVQVSQSVACNRAHEVRHRAARWLLQTHDRVDGDRFELTQEFLASMLGVTRPSVSVAARALQTAGLIRYRRGVLTILDRPGLERMSCECYAAVRAEFEDLFGADADEPETPRRAGDARHVATVSSDLGAFVR